jgi:hypothetical protein
MERLVRRSTEELREGLRAGAAGDNLCPAFEAAREELCLAGFLRDGQWITPAGQRFLRHGIQGCPSRMR